jgi:4-amino-4-deoxy-L-arabinose transferase-like glycosyltransferase
LREAVRSRDHELLLALYWLLLPLAVFFLARSRLQLYVLPLFVPLALLVARPLAGWAWLDGRRTAWIAGATALLLLATKGAVAYYPADRDARAMAEQLRPVVQRLNIEEIAFVGMRPFYGLALYLDTEVEGVHFEGSGLEYSQLLAEETLCQELGARQRNLFVVKRSRTAPFLAVVARCTERTAREVGSFEGDGNELALYLIQPAGATLP